MYTCVRLTCRNIIHPRLLHLYGLVFVHGVGESKMWRVSVDDHDSLNKFASCCAQARQQNVRERPGMSNTRGVLHIPATIDEFYAKFRQGLIRRSQWTPADCDSLQGEIALRNYRLQPASD